MKLILLAFTWKEDFPFPALPPLPAATALLPLLPMWSAYREGSVATDWQCVRQTQGTTKAELVENEAWTE